MTLEDSTRYKRPTTVPTKEASMTSATSSATLNGKAILQLDAIYLLIAAAAGLTLDTPAPSFLSRPQGGPIANSPHAGVGFIEAHGLAFIIGIRMWRAFPLRAWPV